MKIKIKKIIILQILLIPILFLSCNKDKNAENSENNIENHTSEEKIKIPKEDPAFFNMIEVKGGWCTIGYSYNDFLINLIKITMIIWIIDNMKRM